LLEGVRPVTAPRVHDQLIATPQSDWIQSWPNARELVPADARARADTLVAAVHVIALYDGNVPTDMAVGSNESIDEERRLLYVAMTRARRALHLYVPMRYYHRPNGDGDAHGYGKPSRFLTAELQRLCQVTRAGEQFGELDAPSGAGRRIAVSVDALFD
jgi:hypothetical protein